MNQVTRALMDAHAARTPLSKALALHRALDALELQIGVSANGLQKAAGISSMRTEIDRMHGQISQIQARDQHAGSARRHPSISS